jgi:hypothetical protein
MKPTTLEHRVRRRSELSEFMGADLERLLAQQAKEATARMAANAILWHVVTNRASAGDIRGR